MNKRIFCTLLLTLTLTACASNTTRPAAKTQTLSTQAELALGTLRLEDTNYPLSAEQAQDLLPMWYVLQDLNESDAAAQEEINGLVDQIQGAMTSEQTKAIKGMNLSQKDLIEAIQTVNTSSTSTGSSQSGSASSAGGGGFGAPPDMTGGMPGGGAPEMVPSGSTASNTNGNQSPAQTITKKGAPSALLDSVIAFLNAKIND